MYVTPLNTEFPQRIIPVDYNPGVIFVDLPIIPITGGNNFVLSEFMSEMCAKGDL